MMAAGHFERFAVNHAAAALAVALRAELRARFFRPEFGL